MAQDSFASLTWNANSESDLAGYRVYPTQTPGVYSPFFSVGPFATGLTITSVDFTNDGKWYFALSAIDTSGNESAKTSELSKRIIRVHSKLIRRR